MIKHSVDSIDKPVVLQSTCAERVINLVAKKSTQASVQLDTASQATSISERSTGILVLI